MTTPKSLYVTASIATFFLAAAANAATLPFQAGTKIRCFDDVSSETSTIKVTGTAPLTAYVRISGRDGERFYSAAAVTADYEDFELSLTMRTPSGMPEAFLLSASIATGAGIGLYMDGGDSRVLDCELLSRPRS